MLGAVRDGLAREEEDRLRAEGLYRELLRESPRRREKRVLRDPACASPALAARLLKASGEAAPDAPRRAEHLAGLGLAIAGRLASPWGDFLVFGLTGSAWARIGEARRERGDLAGAEQALAEARLRLDVLPVEAAERGLFCRLLARLRRDQERSDEALALAARALALAEAREDREEIGAATLDLGWMELADFESGAALPLFERAAACFLDPDPVRPWFEARRGLALAASDLQDGMRVEEALRELREGAAGLTPLDRLRIERVEAEVDQARDRNAEALAALARVWRGLAEAGAPFEAVDTGLDLVRLSLEQGKGEELERFRAALPRLPRLPVRLRAALALALEEILRPDLPPFGAVDRLDRLQAHLRRYRHASPLPLPA